ncbi:MAG: glycerol kinase [Deltaproteobacteria bacterium RIFCSPLOWO2_02_FULL_50_16]|nr:MAG: glycerol kinase [Deltaproteobacteria bacterium GWA2_50_8]OGQ25852.1 MAG: glycerol kinase [Deltaproteobacteria bacterium RIFCSPHIGHO2_02_FULL_50_15]OGQ55538.1 MAG: glycerol kinase [Deltaproteobacteria bacterium RIFCSPLOWO2_02_FULL_50_16]OGQ65461.1 MAG: glycerol kinase [Deltaproteobacteria bacterium RIFCSPLOWO2_12_FULL_50_11]
MTKDVIMSIDQGTTGTTVVLLDHDLNVLAKHNQEFPQHYPQPGWVEHDPEEIWQCTITTIRKALELAGVSGDRIAGIGITNQRETTIIWDRCTGQALYKAIVWQDRRTAPLCDKLKKLGKEALIRRKTGLVLDPYFSGTKIRWILDHVSGARQRAKDGSLAFGTIDSFLVYKLTGHKEHVTDVSNASRTLLMNLQGLDWDQDLLKLLKIPASLMPLIQPSSKVYGTTKDVPGLPDGIPIAGMAGDQQAALFGQACFKAGEAKCTYGTGSFLVMNTGGKLVRSRYKMLTSVGWQLNGKVTYVLEGSAFIAGAAVQWLRDGLKIISSSPQVEELAGCVSDSGEVTFVPALVGLGAPHWKASARGLISGISRGTTSAHLARAVLEGIALSQYDILKAMEKDLGKRVRLLKVDGGASANNLLMQFQSDILGCQLVRPKMIETTALGAGFLAGLAVGFWKDQQEIANAWREDRVFKPHMMKKERGAILARWNKAVQSA